jgi:hypothetical protein
MGRERHRGAVGGLGLERASEAEVEDADAAVGADHHVVGLEVAVDEARVVGGGQAAAGLDEDRHDLLPGPLLLGEPRAQGLALHELHDDRDLVVERVCAVDVDDVGVRDARDGAGLAQDARPCARRGACDPDDLDRHLALEERVVGGVDHAHAAGAENPAHLQPRVLERGLRRILCVDGHDDRVQLSAGRRAAAAGMRRCRCRSRWLP